MNLSLTYYLLLFCTYSYKNGRKKYLLLKSQAIKHPNNRVRKELIFYSPLTAQATEIWFRNSKWHEKNVQNVVSDLRQQQEYIQKTKLKLRKILGAC